MNCTRAPGPTSWVGVIIGSNDDLERWEAKRYPNELEVESLEETLDYLKGIPSDATNATSLNQDIQETKKSLKKERKLLLKTTERVFFEALSRLNVILSRLERGAENSYLKNVIKLLQEEDPLDSIYRKAKCRSQESSEQRYALRTIERARITTLFALITLKKAEILWKAHPRLLKESDFFHNYFKKPLNELPPVLLSTNTRTTLNTSSSQLLNLIGNRRKDLKNENLEAQVNAEMSLEEAQDEQEETINQTYVNASFNLQQTDHSVDASSSPSLKQISSQIILEAFEPTIEGYNPIHVATEALNEATNILNTTKQFLEEAKARVKRVQAPHLAQSAQVHPG